ncbi:MAG TPA: HAD family hydrolase [Candidatus Angelobacter sp.]|nr:HAD family hydrolase [Candidatus Angelobacter sp.]
MSFESIRLITFDCYGTLIDWENGLLAALRPLFSHDGEIDDVKLLEAYGEIEAALEEGPYLPYRQVLAECAQQLGKRLGVEVSSQQGIEFAQSLTQWKPFADTVPALESLAKKFRLAIISNVDDDLFAETRRQLPVEFAFVVTAQQVKSYKPAKQNFEEALRLGEVNNSQLMHAGQSLYHDIAPTNALGISNIWVNRPSARPGAGAAKPGIATPTYEVQSLSELAELMGGISA